MADLDKAIYDAGMKMGDVRLTVTGELTTWQGEPALKIPESGQVFLLQANDKFRALQQAVGNREGPVTVTGTVKAGGEKSPDLIEIASYSIR